MGVEIIVVGVVVVCGLAVIIFRRHDPWDGGKYDDYGYRVPRTGTWGAGQKSADKAMQDAERGVEHALGEE